MISSAGVEHSIPAGVADINPLVHMDKLDDITLEHILARLSAAALAAAQLACKQWWILIQQRQLWRPHALGTTTATGGLATSVGSQPTDHVDWRRMCLDRFACQRWQSGKLVHSATLQGHTAPITSLAALESIILTGSLDHTARIWNLQQQPQKPANRQQAQQAQQQQQQQVLQHPAPVVAVALVSVDLCVTATASQAYMWRRGKAVRSFAVMPGGSITCIALTDTQLLLGSTAGTVQQYDLYSGSQQLITRHERGVTALYTYQQQQQQQQGDAVQDWSVIIGSADGQVVCCCCSAGQRLWSLPNRYPAAVVALQIVQQQLHQQHRQPGMQQHTKKRKRLQLDPTKATPGQQQQQQQLLLALNARSQVVCWKLPSLSSSSSSSSHTSSTWPLSVCSLQESQVPGVLKGAAAVNSTCLMCPRFGSRFVMTGSTDGSITVAELAHGGSSSSRSKDNSSAGYVTAHSSRVSPEKEPAAAAADTNIIGVQGMFVGPDADNVGWQREQQQDPQSYVRLPAEEVNLLGTQQHTAASHDRSSSSSSNGLHLKVIRRCSLSKLSVVLAARAQTDILPCICDSSKPCSRSTGTSALQGRQEHIGSKRLSARNAAGDSSKAVAVDESAVNVGVKCMAFTAAGQLLVGLESGHVCLLKFKQPRMDC